MGGGGSAMCVFWSEQVGQRVVQDIGQLCDQLTQLVQLGISVSISTV
jgi:hypothetical protein